MVLFLHKLNQRDPQSIAFSFRHILNSAGGLYNRLGSVSKFGYGDVLIMEIKDIYNILSSSLDHLP